MEFLSMRDKLIKNFNTMIKNETHLFEVDVDKDEMWNLYLDSFPEGTNKIYRERRKHDCSCCRQFIKTIGNVVVIKDNKIKTIWDFETNSATYQPVLNALSNLIKSHSVSNIYLNESNNIGSLSSHEKLDNGEVHEWNHFFLNLPDIFVAHKRSIADIKGNYRDTKNVFKRSLNEISIDAINTILELINSNTLYKGEEWKNILIKFKEYKKAYDKLTLEKDKDNFAWEQSVKAGMTIGRIRNYSMGSLLTNISDGMDLDTAVRKYEQIVAPENYKRSKPIYSKKMLEDAQKKITDLGYMDSLIRRYANLDDITVNNILFSNKDAGKRIAGANNIFDEMKQDISENPKKFSRVDEMNIDKFIADILPTASEIELYLDNKLANNMVSLIAPTIPDSKSMFKWNNNFSWAYSGNVTDSMKERVKNAGGKVDGDLRFSIQWNESGDDNCDLDAHCKEPNRHEICYYTYKKPNFSPTAGQLDVDVIFPNGKIAVENITWKNRKTMIEGSYKFYVHQFSGEAKNGFRAEIEFDDRIYSFEYNKPIRQGEKIYVAEVILNADNKFTIKEMIPSGLSSKDMWGVKTNQFVPVSVVCYSPNWWNNQTGVGHKHVFFMLKDCVNTEQPNAFYNEFLNNELYEHRKVMEALGTKLKVKDTDDQLSGVGFSTTKRNEVILKVKGSTKRILKVKF